jgi:pimeloyl-ACP methyl ester carboxylesterase
MTSVNASPIFVKNHRFEVASFLVLFRAILWFDPRREHSSIPTAKSRSRRAQGLSRAGRVFAATRKGSALIGPSTAAHWIGSGLECACHIIAKSKPVVLDGVRAGGDNETWDDMVRLQKEGIYPAAFAMIKVPILMIHGTFDPHPGRLIFAGLRPYLPQLEYRELERCGHYPWLERAAADAFFTLVREWLADNLDATGR